MMILGLSAFPDEWSVYQPDPVEFFWCEIRFCHKILILRHYTLDLMFCYES